jgi:DnaJ-class molecular chaperone
MTDRLADAGECPRCKGKGRIAPKQDFTIEYLLQRRKPCPDCGGVGSIRRATNPSDEFR